MSRIESPFGSLANQQISLLTQIETLSVRLSTGKQYQVAGDSPVEWHESSGLRDRLTHLEAVNGGMNAIALSLRQVHNLAATLGRYMELLQRELEGARDVGVPPSSPELAERRDQHIAQYNTLLSQMDALVNENRDELSRTLTGDPAQVPEAGDLDVVVTENGLKRSIRAQQLHTGPGGLDLQAMPASPTDLDLENVALNLVEARRTLQMKEQSLGWDAAELSRNISSNNDLSARLTTRADELEMADLDATAAGLQSLQVQQSLLINSSKLVHDLRSSLWQILS